MARSTPPLTISSHPGAPRNSPPRRRMVTAWPPRCYLLTTTSGAQRIRRIIVARFEELAGQYDALIAPTLGMVASGLTEDFAYMLPGAFGRPLNFAGVLAGSPSISVYNGLGRDELPTGLHFAGARLQENSILDAAREYEGRTEWTHRRPDIDAICRPAHGSPRGDPDEPAAGRESGLAS